MIKSFTDKETEKVWNLEHSKRLPLDIQRQGRKKLLMLHAACSLEELKVPHHGLPLEEVGMERALLIHPGEILKEEFLDPLGMSQSQLADKASVPAMRISEIVRGRRGITADTALGLAEAFGTSPEFWLNLQMRYDLDLARLNRASAVAG